MKRIGEFKTPDSLKVNSATEKIIELELRKMKMTTADIDVLDSIPDKNDRLDARCFMASVLSQRPGKNTDSFFRKIKGTSAKFIHTIVPVMNEDRKLRQEVSFIRSSSRDEKKLCMFYNNHNRSKNRSYELQTIEVNGTKLLVCMITDKEVTNADTMGGIYNDVNKKK